MHSTEVAVRAASRRMGFEGPASESGEVDADLSGTSWLKMRRLCADAVAHGDGWVYLET